MTEKEKLMYQIMGEITKSGAPIVFKGAMVTKLILEEGGYTALERQTKDIDANWIGEHPSMDALVKTINTSLGALEDKVIAVSFRDYGEKMSAGVSLREKTSGDELFSLDIDMRAICGSRMYHRGEMSIRGVLVNEILSDKISVLSDQMIFRRAKDMVDVYALSQCVEVQVSEIIRTTRSRPDRVIGAFTEFTNRRDELEHAYEKLRGITNKPPFNQLYQYLKVFLQPFISQGMTHQIWNSTESRWEELHVTRYT